MTLPIKLIAFDADDTLWESEPFYRGTEQKLAQLLNVYIPTNNFTNRLYQTESRNLKIFGYGAKAFTLSMIETAIELSDGKITGAEIQHILDLGKDLIKSPIKFLPHVPEVIKLLSETYPLMMITKGDLLDQESKIARSGLSNYFKYIEIVSKKNKQVYQNILKKYNINPAQFLMVGNSLPSDILPVVKLGGHGVHIPFKTTWVHEQVNDVETIKENFVTLVTIAELPALIKKTIED